EQGADCRLEFDGKPGLIRLPENRGPGGPGAEENILLVRLGIIDGFEYKSTLHGGAQTEKNRNYQSPHGRLRTARGLCQGVTYAAEPRANWIPVLSNCDKRPQKCEFEYVADVIRSASALDSGARSPHRASRAQQADTLATSGIWRAQCRDSAQC